MDDELQDELDRLASALGRGVSLDSPAGRLLGYSAQADADGTRVAAILSRQVPPEARAWQEAHQVSRATGPVRVPAHPEHGMAARLCVPVRAHGVTLALLWVLESGTPLSEGEVGAAVAAAERAADLLAARRPRRPGAPVTGDLLRRLVATAPREDPEPVVGALVEADPRLLGARVRVVAGAPARPGRDRVEPWSPAELGSLPGLPGLHGHVGLGPDLLVALLLEDSGDAPAARLRRALAPLRESGRLTLGTSLPTSVDAAALRRGWDQAWLAARASSVESALGDDVAWEDLGLHRVFTGVDDLTAWQSPLDLGADDAPESLAVLLDTLEAYLDRAGNAQATAKALTLHRTSLYYRLNRATEALGTDLADGSARTHLHLALKARRLARARAALLAGP